MTKRNLPAHVRRRVSASGKEYLYFMRGNRSVAMKERPGSPEFALEYARLLTDQPDTSGPRTLARLVTAYRKSAGFKNLAPRTQADYEKVMAYVDAKMGALPADRMQRKDVIRARDTNADSVRFANYIVQVLRVMFEFSIDLGWRDSNPAKGVGLLKSTGTGREPWPADKIAAYRATAKGRALLIFELCIGTGQRIGDVLRMQWNDLADNGINVRQGKTGARLWVPLPAETLAAVTSARRYGLTICAQPNGRPTSYRGAADMVMDVRKKIGAEAYDLHSLRYTKAADMAASGCSDDEIQSITGHTTKAMVRKYAGPVRQIAQAKRAARKLERNGDGT